MCSVREVEDVTLRRMSPAEKIEVMNALIRQAFALKAAGIRALRPDLSEEEVVARAKALMAGDHA